MTTQRDYSFQQAFAERSQPISITIAMLTLLQVQARHDGDDHHADMISPHIDFLTDILSQSIGSGEAETMINHEIYEYALWVGSTLRDIDQIDPVEEAERIIREGNQS